MQVGRVHDVHVDDPERAHPGSGQIEGSRRTEPARPEQQDLRAQQLDLARHVHLGKQQVPLVPVALLRAEHGWRLPRTALVLPAVEAAGHADGVRVTELSQSVSRERAADPPGAVDDDPGAGVGDPAR